MTACDVTGILSEKQIATLKKGYDAEGMNAVARVALTSSYPPGKPLVDLLIDRFFDASRWRPDERELCIITTLAQQGRGEGRFLAIHLYWGLMEGLSPDRLADTLLLTGIYTGFSTYNAGLGTLRRVLTRLASLTEGAEVEERVKFTNIVRELLAEFG